MKGICWTELVQGVAIEFGIKLSDADADHILYEETGFPEFWDIPKDGKNAAECAQTQLRRYFLGQSND